MDNYKIPTLEEYLFEDVVIPPELSTQYLAVKKQIIDKQNQKDLLMKQANQKDTEIGILQKNLIAIESKASQLQGKQVTVKTETETPTATPIKGATSNESIDIKSDLFKIYEEKDLELELDEALSDDIYLLISGNDIEDKDEEEDEEDDMDESDYVFAIRAEDSGGEEEIIAKFYKNSDDDFWKVRVVKGSEEPLESMQFDPDMDLVSILEKIVEIYDDVEEVDMDEYEDLLNDREEEDEKYEED